MLRRTNSTSNDILEDLRALQTPTQLLKFGSSGKPGFRFFQLSQDCSSLIWQSKSKNKDQTRGELPSLCTELRLLTFFSCSGPFDCEGDSLWAAD